MEVLGTWVGRPEGFATMAQGRNPPYYPAMHRTIANLLDSGSIDQLKLLHGSKRSHCSDGEGTFRPIGLKKLILIWVCVFGGILLAAITLACEMWYIAKKPREPEVAKLLDKSLDFIQSYMETKRSQTRKAFGKMSLESFYEEMVMAE